MAVNDHNDKFVINDITLSIPPTEIHIQQEAQNYEWQTLRTTNATKIKSGHGLITISFTAMFVNTDQINLQLRYLLAQLRATPICYVENQYLRQHLMPDDPNSNMALILKSLELVFRSDQHDCIVANFEFGWFNYAPYSAHFWFKKDINLPIISYTPALSRAWTKFYKPLLSQYAPIPNLDNSSLGFEFAEYKLGMDIVGAQATDLINNERDINQVGFDKPVDIKAAAKRNAMVQAWRKPDNEGYVPTSLVYPVSDGTDALIYARNSDVECNAANGLIVTAISVVFENILAAIPLLGHQYATYQHIGSLDPRVTMKIMATSDPARQRINQMWNSVEDNAIKFRHIPKQFLDLKINNSFIQFCGLNTFITDQLMDETIPGQPGTYSFTLSLRGTKYDIDPEKLTQEYVSDNKVRNEILRTLNGTLDSIPRPSGGLIHTVLQSHIPDTEQSKFLHDISQLYANILNKWALQIYFSAFGLDVFQNPADLANPANPITATALNLVKNSGTSLSPLGLLVRSDTTKSAFDVLVSDLKAPFIQRAITICNILVSANDPINGNPALGQISNLILNQIIAQAVPAGTPIPQDPRAALQQLQQFNASNVPTQKSADPNADPTNSQLQTQNIEVIIQFYSDLDAFTDSLIRGGLIFQLDEFTQARALMSQVGGFTGKSAYPDMPFLNALTATEGLEPLSLDPDFYFINPITDSGKPIIDPVIYKQAQAIAQNLYTQNSASTGNVLADWFNHISRFYEQAYTTRLQEGSKLKNQLTQDVGTPTFLKNPTPSISREMTVGLSWTNALSGNGLALNNAITFNRIVSSLLPETHQVAKATTSISHSTDPGQVFNPNTPVIGESSPVISTVDFICPTPGARISSDFGPRPQAPPGHKEHSTFHRGVDYAVEVGTHVLATADGTCHVEIQGGDPNGLQGWGQFVTILHTINGEQFTSLYAHLSKVTVSDGQVIKQGDQIAESGGANNAFGSGNSESPHLHFEIHEGNTRDPDSAVDPEKLVDSPITSVQTQTGGQIHYDSSLFGQSVEEMHRELSSGQFLRMARAYPTFKLYFVEENTLDEVFFGFDDFFSYNAVKSIRVVRSRKIPADLCVIELTNISGVLSNRKFRNTRNRAGEDVSDRPFTSSNTLATRRETDPHAVNTRDQNPVASLMLQEGVKLVLKMGYSTDPDKLDLVFIGEIAEVEFSETDDLVTIVCQSYATELTQQVKGVEEPINRGGWFLSTSAACTSQLLSDMMQQPEVLHFGRWKRSHIRGNTATNTNWDLLHNNFEWQPAPQDDNIFPPRVDLAKYNDNLTKGLNFLLDPSSFLTSSPSKIANLISFHYYIYKTTIWDIFKEMELRHPGCIASPVPYMDRKFGPRMTMFFGVPNQKYFARDPNPVEQAKFNFVKKTVQDAKVGDNLFNLMQEVAAPSSDLNSALINLAKGNNLAAAADLASSAAGAISGKEKQIKDAYLKILREQVATETGQIKPFRAYHILTANNHIVANNIRASAVDVYNTVSVEYTVPKPITDKSLSEILNPSSVSNVELQGSELVAKNKDVFQLKADAALPDSDVREALLQFPSCEGVEMAKAYAMGSLKNFLKDIYKGELTIIGNPSIKPYDVCYLVDTYSDIIGPVEVQQVVHYFSQETGFITEITPDIFVNINEWSTMTSLDAVGLVAEGFIRSFPQLVQSQNNAVNQVLNLAGLPGISPPVFKAVEAAGAGAIAATVATNPFLAQVVAGSALVGVFMGYKIINWLRMRHPVSFSPLMYKGHPLISAVGNKVLNNNIITDLEHWVSNGVDGFRFGLRNWIDYLDSVVDDPIAARGSLINLGDNTLIGR